jgi:signal transduction histidine kinase
MLKSLANIPYEVRLPLKIRLFLPVLVIIVVIVSSLTLWFLGLSFNSINLNINNNLKLHVEAISRMFEREQALKLKKVQSSLKVASEKFNSGKLHIEDNFFSVKVENQITGEESIASLHKWSLNGKELYNDTSFVDSVFELVGGTITIFQKIDSGYARLVTNVLKTDGSRASGTYIPNNSQVVNSIENNETFFGRAFVVNDWYTTAYQPIFSDSLVVGMIYVGDKEKDLDELKRILSTLNIGKSGYPFVFNCEGKLIIHPYAEGETLKDSILLEKACQLKKVLYDGTKLYEDGSLSIAYRYFEPFDLIIAAKIDTAIEKRELYAKLISVAGLIGGVSILFLLVFLYFFTTERIYKYLTALELSKQRLKSTQQALKQSEKLAAMGQISAGIAHELNNPLGVITMYSNVLIDELPDENPIKKDIQLIVEQANRCKNIVGGLLNFARSNKLNLEVIEIRNILEDSLRSIVVPVNVKVSVNYNTTRSTIRLDSDLITQVFVNLLKNAVDAMDDGGELSINVVDGNEEMIISFTDTGVGIKDEDMDKLFTPFFTTKKMGYGTGLGLALVYGIVKMHKGQITVKSNTDPSINKTGTTFTLNLPRNLG